MPVLPAEEWPPPPRAANWGMPKEPPPPPLVRPARDSSSEAGKAEWREGAEPLRRCPLTEGYMQPWPVTGCPEQEKTWRSRNRLRGRGGGARSLTGTTRGDPLPADWRQFLPAPLGTDHAPEIGRTNRQGRGNGQEKQGSHKAAGRREREGSSGYPLVGDRAGLPSSGACSRARSRYLPTQGSTPARGGRGQAEGETQHSQEVYEG